VAFASGELSVLAAPDSLHSILAYVPARFAQFDGDAAITIPAKPVSQRDDGPGQCVFVIPLGGLVALVPRGW